MSPRLYSTSTVPGTGMQLLVPGYYRGPGRSAYNLSVSDPKTMSKHLVIRHSPFGPSTAKLAVVLRGHVTQGLVNDINARLARLGSEEDVRLNLLPQLRFQQGHWEFHTKTRARFYPVILLKAFHAAADAHGWVSEHAICRMEKEYSRAVKLMTIKVQAARAVHAAATVPGKPGVAGEEKVSSWREEQDPASGRTFYQNTTTEETTWDKPAELAASPQKMLDADDMPPLPPIAETWQLDLMARSDPLQNWPSIKYVGEPADELWRPFVGETVGGFGEMIPAQPNVSLSLKADTVVPLGDQNVIMFGCGWDAHKSKVDQLISGGGSAGIDIDTNVYLLNKYGEMLYSRPVNPKDKKQVPGVIMGLDSVSGEGEGDDERFVVQLDHLHGAVHTVLVCLKISSGALDFSQVRGVYIRYLDVTSVSGEDEIWRYDLPMDQVPKHHRTSVVCRLEKHPELSTWQLRTMNEFIRPLNVGMKPVIAGDILTAINGIPLLACHTLNGYSKNMQRLAASLSYGTCRLSFNRPIPNYTRETSHLLKFSDPEKSKGGRFELMFDPNGTTNCGITFREDKASVVVASINHFQFKPKVEQILKPFALHSVPLPVGIRLDKFSAVIPATDRGGTTDAYLRISHKVAQIGGVLSVKDYKRVKLAESKVQRKLRCPADVQFPGISVDVPVSSMVGMLQNCTIAVMDKDRISRDDPILEHDVDLTWLFDGRSSIDVTVHPNRVHTIEDLKQNAGFTSQQVILRFRATIIPSDLGPAAAGGVPPQTPPRPPVPPPRN